MNSYQLIGTVLEILFMGGTRFVGKTLLAKFQGGKNDITLFTRGINQIPDNVQHLIGDRGNNSDLEKLKGKNFDVIVDSSGRSLEDTQKVINYIGKPRHRLLYVSSAGIYSHDDIYPFDEFSAIDLKSRHIGKVETERWLSDQGIPFTSFRPTYIYGPGNYNPIEKWFFDRITYRRTIPIPGDGQFVTQLGHVQDLADAMFLSLEKEIALNKIYNCSSDKGITFMGILKISAEICGIDPCDLPLKKINPEKLNSKSRKLFPIRTNNFFTDISKIKNDLNWLPNYTIKDGFKESYEKDYLLLEENNVDFSLDNQVLEV